jgi:hypothetical protein
MSKTGRPNPRRGRRGTRKAERRIVVRAIRRNPPDLRKLSRAVIAIAMREAEADADARDAMKGKAPDKPAKRKSSAAPESEVDHDE